MGKFPAFVLAGVVGAVIGHTVSLYSIGNRIDVLEKDASRVTAFVQGLELSLENAREEWSSLAGELGRQGEANEALVNHQRKLDESVDLLIGRINLALRGRFE